MICSRFVLIFCAFILLPSVGLSACGGEPIETSSGFFLTYDASFDCVSSAIDNYAQSGGVVRVANGDATWSSQLVVNKELTLIGGNGTITVSGTSINSFAVKFSPTDPTVNDRFELYGFTFHGVYILDLNNPATDTTILNNIIIHDCTFTQTSDAYLFQISGNPVYGVMYHCTIDAAYGEAFNLLGRDSNWNNFIHAYGTSNSFFFEDNTFTHMSDRPIDSGRGHTSYVARYNAIAWVGSNTESAFDMHGDQAAGCGNMVSEIYGNSLGVHDAVDMLTNQRGSWVLAFGNLKEGARGLLLNLYNDDGNLSGTCEHPANPISNDINNSYYWANFNGSGSAASVSASDGIPTVNTDYWMHTNEFNGTVGVGCGSIASRPATCTIGVGYWATDQSCSDLTGMAGTNPASPIRGTLYKCTATNTWTAYYQPYTYPHPLRGEYASLGAGSKSRLSPGSSRMGAGSGRWQ